MLTATIAIAGIPPLAGFFSKDEILHGAFASGNYVVWAAGILGAGLTAFYMFRLYILAFRGTPRMGHDAEHHVHESPPSMIVPLAVLAILSVIGGWVGPPMMENGHPFGRWLEPVFASGTHGIAGSATSHPAPAGDVPHGAADAVHGAASHDAGHALPRSTEILLIVLSVGVAATGIALAFQFYERNPGAATRLRERLSGVHRALLNKYWVDELYDAVVVRPVRGVSVALWRFWDEKIVDGLVNGVGYTLEGVSAVLRLFQTGFVGTYALFFAIGVLALFLAFVRS
jgi:NADH-quinone oxidoreductase subunit L